MPWQRKPVGTHRAIAGPSGPKTLAFIAAALREAGIATELYMEAKKLKAQFKYADVKGFPFVIVAGSRKIEAGAVTLKHLASGTQATIPTADLADAIKAQLAG